MTSIAFLVIRTKDCSLSYPLNPWQHDISNLYTSGAGLHTS